MKKRPLIELLELAEQRERWNRQVGEKLRQAREHAGLTQRELAERLGVSQVYVSHIERGRGVSADQLRLFTDAIAGTEPEGETSGRSERQAGSKPGRRPRRDADGGDDPRQVRLDGCGP